MSHLKKVMNKKGLIQYRVWYHAKKNMLGVGLPGTWFGDLFLFAEHRGDQVLDGSFCNFLDDPRDAKSLFAEDIIDLGPL
jgi:hypothetical protein